MNPWKTLSILVVTLSLTSCTNNIQDMDPEYVGEFPVYGNWCGPKHPQCKDEKCPQAIDTLDKACMEHDRCYAERGYFDCVCDRHLVDALNRQKIEALDKKLAVMAYFSQSPCDGNYLRKGIQNLTADTFIVGKMVPWEVSVFTVGLRGVRRLFDVVDENDSRFYQHFYQDGGIKQRNSRFTNDSLNPFNQNVTVNKVERFYESGELYSTQYRTDEKWHNKVLFRNGKLHKEGIYDIQTNLNEIAGYYEDGQPMLNFKYELTGGLSMSAYDVCKTNTPEVSYCRATYANGNPKYFGEYLNGVKHGSVRIFYENGVLMYEMYYQHGVLQGYLYSFYDSGALLAKFELKDGKIVGYSVSYFETGEIRYESYYDFENRENMEFVEYNKDGTKFNESDNNKK